MDELKNREYEKWRDQLAKALEAAASAHDAGDLQAIEGNYDEMDGNLPRNSEARYTKLHIALNFWDGWIDGRNHGWHYYEGIGRKDWSDLARQVAKALREDQEITEERVLRYFNIQRGKP